MLNNYDNAANFYDTLSRIVFFKAQVNAQIEQLKHIAANSRILIIGGGSGWILEELAKVHESSLHITYVEISSKMLDIAKKRNSKNNKVTFVNSSIEDWDTDTQYDVIMTAFLFDNFAEDRAFYVFHKLYQLLKEQGLWLYSDFSYDKATGEKWQGFILKSMYFFFKVLCNIEAAELIDMTRFFKEKEFKKLNEQTYYSGFIKSSIWQKN